MVLHHEKVALLDELTVLGLEVHDVGLSPIFPLLELLHPAFALGLLLLELADLLVQRLLFANLSRPSYNIANQVMPPFEKVVVDKSLEDALGGGW